MPSNSSINVMHDGKQIRTASFRINRKPNAKKYECGKETKTNGGGKQWANATEYSHHKSPYSVFTEPKMGRFCPFLPGRERKKRRAERRGKTATKKATTAESGRNGDAREFSKKVSVPRRSFICALFSSLSPAAAVIDLEYWSNDPSPIGESQSHHRHFRVSQGVTNGMRREMTMAMVGMEMAREESSSEDGDNSSDDQEISPTALLQATIAKNA
ncbi:hypothetical protein niasHT_017016 [Heterodera trifolii]|uniref:Uncharacterized protein n=1 Tax=Heterodera trifolii TaxID=157864 RepID=A0ABD2KZV5_9BILA